MPDDLDTRTTTGLAERQPTRELDRFDVLDTYAGGVAPEEARIEAIATISAGTKNDKGNPVVSRNGVIHLHDAEGRAPGLKKALDATGGKSLTIAFPFDDPRMFIQQRFVEYSASRLLAYGDQHAVTVIGKDGTRTEVDAETDPDEYRSVVARCKTSFSVYFNLVEWEGGQPVIVFPDGLGFYRVRFTGRNSARSFMGQLRLLTRFTSGRLAGVPFDLRIVNREVADPTGARRTIPVFVPTMKAPGMRLDSTNFRGVLQDSLGQADALRLQPPAPETIEDAEAAGPSPDLDAPALTDGDDTEDVTFERVDDPDDDAEPDEHDLARLQSHLDYDTERSRFFATVRGTPYEGDEARADLLARYFGPDDDGHHAYPWAEGIDPSSLHDVLPRVAPHEWDEFLAWIDDQSGRAQAIAADRAANVDATTYGEGVTERHVAWLEDQLARAEAVGFDYRDRLPFLAWALDMPADAIRRNEHLTPELFDDLRDFLGVTRAGKYRPLTDDELGQAVAKFASWRHGDDAAQEALGL